MNQREPYRLDDDIDDSQLPKSRTQRLSEHYHRAAGHTPLHSHATRSSHLAGVSITQPGTPPIRNASLPSHGRGPELVSGGVQSTTTPPWTQPSQHSIPSKSQVVAAHSSTPSAPSAFSQLFWPVNHILSAFTTPPRKGVEDETHVEAVPSPGQLNSSGGDFWLETPTRDYEQRKVRQTEKYATTSRRKTHVRNDTFVADQGQDTRDMRWVSRGEGSWEEGGVEYYWGEEDTEEDDVDYAEVQDMRRKRVEIDSATGLRKMNLGNMHRDEEQDIATRRAEIITPIDAKTASVTRGMKLSALYGEEGQDPTQGTRRRKPVSIDPKRTKETRSYWDDEVDLAAQGMKRMNMKQEFAYGTGEDAKAMSQGMRRKATPSVDTESAADMRRVNQAKYYREEEGKGRGEGGVKAREKSGQKAASYEAQSASGMREIKQDISRSGGGQGMTAGSTWEHSKVPSPSKGDIWDDPGLSVNALRGAHAEAKHKLALIRKKARFGAEQMASNHPRWTQDRYSDLLDEVLDLQAETNRKKARLDEAERMLRDRDRKVSQGVWLGQAERRVDKANGTPSCACGSTAGTAIPVDDCDSDSATSNRTSTDLLSMWRLADAEVQKARKRELNAQVKWKGGDRLWPRTRYEGYLQETRVLERRALNLRKSLRPLPDQPVPPHKRIEGNLSAESFTPPLDLLVVHCICNIKHFGKKWHPPSVLLLPHSCETSPNTKAASAPANHADSQPRRVVISPNRIALARTLVMSNPATLAGSLSGSVWSTARSSSSPRCVSFSLKPAAPLHHTTQTHTGVPEAKVPTPRFPFSRLRRDRPTDSMVDALGSSGGIAFRPCF
ncbi:hypothetical protein DFP72DRAFT_1084553 [Ephemerocybe angulata]|uniref:Uncharacterized protein n=1 Tax=Ephemerocybe angulata TaxID=980116 RepID=A0A8H6H6A3_9AGAR|nr:hypothetical protein DFP72DRAFT_1084553 [Tulosesus angulatus]